MNFTIEFKDQEYNLNSGQGIDLSIPNNFDGNHPTFYGASAPSVNPIEIGDFVGNVEKGGSCNVKVATLDIHCTGTHTECVGHITNSEKKISDLCPREFLFAQVITVDPVLKSDTDETYHVECEKDWVISASSLNEQLEENVESLILRTLPNDIEKLSRNYDVKPAPFLTHESIDLISQKGIQHLLVDLPSVDRANDGGQLGNHHRFFKTGKTISELLYIPNSVLDGLGFLQIQIPNWGLDAAPSRPIFYPI